MTTLCRVLTFFLCLTTATPQPDGSVWRTFRSVKYRYATTYPASWYQFKTELRPSLDYLDILNFPPSERAEGVVLKDGGAEITVGPAPQGMRTLQDWIRKATKLDSQVEQRGVKEFTKTPSGCTELVKVTSLFEVGPGRNFVHTSYYCSTNRGMYAVSLTNWERDPQQKKYQAIALRVASSLTAW
jgi:hypothetical protein